MQRFKEILRRLLFPGAAVVLFSVPVAAALLAYTFLAAGEESPIAYIAYVFSAYALTIVCANLVPLVRRANRMVRRNPYVSRYLEDVPFRLEISLHLSLGINFLFAGFHALSGIYYQSLWFGTLSVYYIFLAVMRYLLVRYAHKNDFGQNRIEEFRRCRHCGAILITMNIALAGVVVLMLRQNRSFHYAGSLIYVVALYTFYTTIMAVVNLVRDRKSGSPLMAAARGVNLAAALVSMLSLETAMLTQFNDGSKGAFFRRAMIGSTGGAVCVLVTVMGLYMVIHATRRIRKLRADSGPSQDK